MDFFNLLYINYHLILSGTTSWLFQLEIVGIPTGLGLYLANYLHTLSLYFMYILTPWLKIKSQKVAWYASVYSMFKVCQNIFDVSKMFPEQENFGKYWPNIFNISASNHYIYVLSIRKYYYFKLNMKSFHMIYSDHNVLGMYWAMGKTGFIFFVIDIMFFNNLI